MKIESLRPYQKKVNVTVKVVKVNESREVSSKLDDSKHTVTEALVGDDTGTVLLTLWDDDISSVQPDQSYDIVNGFTSLFKQSLRLNVGRYGELKAAEVPLEAINEANNLSGSEGEAPAPTPVEETVEAKETPVEETAVAKEEPVAEAATEKTKEEGSDCSDCPGCGSEESEEPTAEAPAEEVAEAEPVVEESVEETTDEPAAEEAPVEKEKPKEEKKEESE